MPQDSLAHLQGHHRDFAAFRDVIIQTSAGRFGPLWWGFWAQHVAAAVPEEGTVVDLGTGPALLLPALRERHPRARLVGVEVQPAMLPVAREVVAGCGAELLEADLMGAVDLPDACADVVTSVMVFHELPHPPVLLDLASRLVKPGGSLVLLDWVRQPLARYLEGREPSPEVLQHFREHCLFTGEDLEFLLDRAGFDLVERVGRKSEGFACIAARRREPAA